MKYKKDNKLPNTKNVRKKNGGDGGASAKKPKRMTKSNKQSTQQQQSTPVQSEVGYHTDGEIKLEVRFHTAQTIIWTVDLVWIESETSEALSYCLFVVVVTVPFRWTHKHSIRIQFNYFVIVYSSFK